MTRAHRPTGFTLLEVLLAIMLTAVAVTIAGVALRTASDTRDRVDAHRQTLERDGRFRSALTDMLRHAPSAESVEEPLLGIARSPDGGTTLTFLSKGVRAPFGTGPTWRVTLRTTEEGLVLEARPLDASVDGTWLRSVLPWVRSISVQVLERAGATDGARWRTDWPLAQARPAMIAIGFDERAPGAERTGASVTVGMSAVTSPPLRVALDPLAMVAVRP